MKFIKHAVAISFLAGLSWIATMIIRSGICREGGESGSTDTCYAEFAQNGTGILIFVGIFGFTMFIYAIIAASISNYED